MFLKVSEDTEARNADKFIPSFPGNKWCLAWHRDSVMPRVRNSLATAGHVNTFWYPVFSSWVKSTNSCCGFDEAEEGLRRKPAMGVWGLQITNSHCLSEILFWLRFQFHLNLARIMPYTGRLKPNGVPFFFFNRLQVYQRLQNSQLKSVWKPGNLSFIRIILKMSRKDAYESYGLFNLLY